MADDENLPGVRGRLVVAVACWSSDRLAKLVTDPGRTAPVRCYVGWLDEVSWPEEWRVPIGRALLDALSILFEGATAAQLCEALRAEFEAAHDVYRDSGDSTMSPDQVRFGKMCALYWRDRLDVQGDLLATL